MDPLQRSLSHHANTVHKHLRGASFITMLIVCAILIMVATAVFRWRVFTAGSKYVIFLIAILFFLIWIGRFTRRK